MFLILFDLIFIFINYYNIYINFENVLVDGVMKIVIENCDSLNVFFFIIKKEFEKLIVMKNYFIFNFNMVLGFYKLIILLFL